MTPSRLHRRVTLRCDSRAHGGRRTYGSCLGLVVGDHYRSMGSADLASVDQLCGGGRHDQPAVGTCTEPMV